MTKFEQELAEVLEELKTAQDISRLQELGEKAQWLRSKIEGKE